MLNCSSTSMRAKRQSQLNTTSKVPHNAGRCINTMVRRHFYFTWHRAPCHTSDNTAIPEYEIAITTYEKLKNTLHAAVRSTKKCFLIKTQVCKLRVILRSRVLRGAYPRE